MVMKAGDFILTVGDSSISNLISLGQSLRFRGQDKPFARFTHVALVIDENGTLIEALGHGVVRSHISSYNSYTVVSPQMTDHDRSQVLEYAHSVVGRKYGYAKVFFMGLSLLTGLNVSVGFEEEQICSTLVAKALERAGVTLPRDCGNVMPADLAKFYNV